MPLLLLIGFVSILGQVVLLRELAVAFYGNELVYLVSIAVWMIWTGAGALLGRGNGAPSGKSVIAAVFALGVAIPGAILFIRAVRIIFQSTPGAFLPLEQQFAAIVLSLAPAGLLLGFLFVQAARCRIMEGGTFAGSYGIESLGGVAGGIVSLLLPAGNVPVLATSILTAVLLFAVCAILTRRTTGPRLLFAVIAILLCVIFLFAGKDLDRATQRWHFPFLLESRDTPYGRLTLTSRLGQIALFENGAFSLETESTDPEEVVHPAMLQHPEPRRVLLIGGGIAGTVREALRHRPEAVDYVEIDRQILRLAVEHLPDSSSSALRSPCVRIIESDGRAFLKKPGELYDVILVDMPDPNSGGTNRFYTVEFFRECSERMKERGILAFRLTSAEQQWIPLLARRNASIRRALGAVFSDVVVLPGEVNTFIASNGPLSTDPETSSRRLLARGVKTSLVTPSYINWLYTNDRFAEVEKSLRETESPMNSDLKPVCYPYTLLLWLTKFHRSFARMHFESGSPAWWAIPFFAVLFLIVRRSPRRSGLFLVAFAGAAGVVIEFALLLRFQTTAGVLYRDMGLLFAGFMAGLAAGPLPGGWAAKRRHGGALLLFAFALFSGLTAFLIRGAGTGHLIVCFIMLFLTGLGVGSIFCCTSGRMKGNGASLYAADLIGGSAGALAGSLFLLPFLGLDLSMIWISALALLGLLFAGRVDRLRNCE